MNFGNVVDPDNNLHDIFANTDDYSCSYFNVENIKNKLKIINGISITNFNIRSFTKNVSEFSACLQTLNQSYDVIVLTETWLKEDTADGCCLPGYYGVHNYRLDRSGGGVSIFIKDKFKFEVNNNLKISNEFFESISIKFRW